MLCRLIYVSEVAQALTPAGVQQILDHARVKNAAQHITGWLAFDSSYFLQVVEGRRVCLSALLGRLYADQRHSRLEVMEFTAVPERRFARWNMGFAAADRANGELFKRFGGTPHFEPATMGAASALGLLELLAAAPVPSLDPVSSPAPRR